MIHLKYIVNNYMYIQNYYTSADKAESGESSANAIELQSNVIYEYRKPVPCQQNPAYDLVLVRTSK